MARGLITDEEKKRVSEYNKRYYQLHKQRLKEKRDSEPEYLKERRKLRMLMTTCLRYRLDNDYRRERKAYQRTRYRRKKIARLIQLFQQDDAEKNPITQISRESD